MLGSLTLRNQKNHSNTTPALALRETVITKPNIRFTESKVCAHVGFHLSFTEARQVKWAGGGGGLDPILPTRKTNY